MEIAEVISVAGLSTVKIIPAVALAIIQKLSSLEIFIAIAVGGISGIVFFSYWGTLARKGLKKRRKKRAKNKKPKKINYRRNRRLLIIWKKFGLYGIAFLTPPILSPPVGAIIAVSFGEKQSRIILFMTISTLFWALVFALFGQSIVELIEGSG